MSSLCCNFHCTPFFIISSPTSILLQVLDIVDFFIPPMIPCQPLYFPTHVWAHRELRDEIILHISLARTKVLVNFKLLSPRPSCFLGEKTVFHATKCIFLFSSPSPYKNFLLTFSNSPIIKVGILIDYMQYARIAKLVVCISSSLAALDSVWAFQPLSFALILSIRNM